MVLRTGIIVAALFTLVSCGKKEGGMWVPKDYAAPARSVRPQSTKERPVAAVPAVVSVPDGYVPRYALEEAERFTREFLRENSRSASGVDWRFLYAADGSACVEYTVTPKGSYTWPEPAWIGYTWGNSSGSIGNNEVLYTLTKKQSDEAEYRMEERRKEAAFRDIEKAVFQIALDYDYDFYDAYRIPVNYRNPQVNKAVCDGYADAVVKRLSSHPLVQKVEKWTGSNHAWNVIALRDGRKLYCDATWYDGNSIDDDGYVVTVPRQDPCALTFDKHEFDSLGGAIDRSTGRLLAVHFAGKNITQEL